MSELIDRQALRAAHGLGTDCNDCKRDMKSCQYDRDYSLMDFCEWIDDAPAAPRWVRCEERLPENNDAVNVVWVNRNPESYYADIKDKPFVSTAHYHKGKWYWFSSTCKDFLDEYGRCEVDEVDKDIDILYWMPLPSPPVNKLFTK